MEGINIIGVTIIVTIIIVTVLMLHGVARDIDNQIENIKIVCGYIFNPATTLSNYTSYKHCLEYPQTYGVGK